MSRTTESGAGAAIGRDAAVGAVWQTFGFAYLTACGYIVTVLLARSFGPAVFGVYGVVYSVLMATELLLRLGVPQALSRLIAANTGASVSQLQSTGITLTLVLNLAGFAIIWLAAPVLADALNLPDGTRLFRIAVLDIPFYALYTCLVNVLNARRQFTLTGLVSSAYGFTKVFGILALMMTDRLTIEAALVVNIASSVIGMLLLLGPAGMAAFRPSLAAKASIIALAIPITIGDIGHQILLGIDLWLLNALGSVLPADVKGDYVAALSLARLPSVIAFVLTAVLIPSIARALGSDDRAMAGRLVLGTTRFLILLVLPVCALVATNAVDLMTLLFSADYEAGARYLVLLVFAQGLGYTCVGAFQAILVGAGAARVAARRTYAALAVAIVMNVLLIPPLGAVGAGLAALISSAVAMVLMALAVRQRVGVLLEPRSALLALLASLALGLASWFIPTAGWMVFVEFAGLAIAYLAVIWMTGLLHSGDIALLRRPQVS
jgi:O-antigen/teichoic acid export membrane protein